MGYADIIKKKSKEWDCPELMTGAYAARGGDSIHILPVNLIYACLETTQLT